MAHARIDLLSSPPTADDLYRKAINNDLDGVPARSGFIGTEQAIQLISTWLDNNFVRASDNIPKPVGNGPPFAAENLLVRFFQSSLRPSHFDVVHRHFQSDASAWWPRNPDNGVEITGGNWKPIHDDLQGQIGEVVRLIEDLTRRAKQSNLSDGERVLTKIERAQLIAVLKTALNVLKSPMVETGLLKTASAMVKRAGEKAAEKEVEIAFAAAASTLATALMELVKRL